MQEHAALIRPGGIDTIPYRGGVQAQSGVRPAAPEFGSESGESSLPTPQSHVSATPQSDDESSFWSDLSDDDPSAAPAGFGYPEDNQTLDNYAAECAEIAEDKRKQALAEEEREDRRGCACCCRSKARGDRISARLASSSTGR